MSLDSHEQAQRHEVGESSRRPTFRESRAARADELTEEIKRQERDERAWERSEQASTLLTQMRMDRTFILMQLSSCTLPQRDDWRQRLGSVDLTSPRADAVLRELQREVELERMSWRIGREPRGAGRVEPPPAIGPAGRAGKQRLALERQRRHTILVLELVASSLGTLVSARGLYARLTR